MKKKNIIITLLLIGILVWIVSIYQPRHFLQNIDKVEKITLYNISSKKVVHISDKDEINNYISQWKQMIIKKEKIVGNSWSKGLLVILYSEDGNTIDTFYVSKKNLLHHHWLIQIINEINPYDELMLKFQEK